MTAAQPRITIDPKVLAGKPIIRGTRLSVEFMIGLMADGWNETDILANHPGMTHDDVIACLPYARDTLSSEKVFPSASLTCASSLLGLKGGLRRSMRISNTPPSTHSMRRPPSASRPTVHALLAFDSIIVQLKITLQTRLTAGLPMTNIDFDPNKIASEVFTSIIRETASSIKNYVKSPISKLIEAFKFSMEEYIKITLKKCSSIRTFLNRDEPVDIMQVYVQTTFKSGDNLYADEELIDNLPSVNQIVILGSAGCGKSMFMKYFFVRLCERPGRRVPLFIELRHLTGVHSKDLIAFMFHSVVVPGGVATEEQFKKGLESGLFTIILDGFDEVDFDERKTIEKEILSLRDRFPGLPIIVSSREDERFMSWGNFHLFHVMPLGKDQVIILIGKSKYDEDVKKKFVKALKDELFEKHQSFLSNPLLAIMMLITFKEIAHIPDKLHIFYDQAFDALFFKHDASKEAAFRRKSHTGLPIDEFKRILSCFSIATYIKERFSFVESQIKEDIIKASEIAKVTIDPGRYLNDLLESVCILQRDGIQIVFTHRSFQEYFAAVFIDKCSTAVDKMLDVLCRRTNDIVLQLVFDMNRSRIERDPTSTLSPFASSCGLRNALI
jgi:uncharacterized protein (DUF433 family)